jgi:hypothetical protein
MANTIKATLIMKDSYGDYYKKELETRVTVLADAQTAVDGFLTALNPCSDLEVESVTYSFRDSTQVLAGELNSNRDIGATFIGRNADGEAIVLKIPGFPSSKVGAQRAIDLTDVEVAALLAEFEALGDFYISDGETAASWVKGTLDK